MSRARASAHILLATIVAVISVASLAGPMALRSIATDILQEDLRAVPVMQRDVRATSPSFPQFTVGPTIGDPSTDSWQHFSDQLELARTAAPAPLPTLLERARIVSTITPLPIEEARQTQAVTLMFSPEYERDVKLLDGRLPQPTRQVGDGEYITDIIVSRQTATELDWRLGDTRTLRSIPTLYLIRIVGFFEATEPASDFWRHQPSVLQPINFDDGNQPRKLTGSVIAHPQSILYAGLLDGVGRSRPTTQVWFPFREHAVAPSNATTVANALDEFSANPITLGSPGTIGIASLSPRVDVVEPLRSAVAEQQAMNAVMLILATGPIGVAAAVLLLCCRSLAESRRSTLRVLASRGAAPAQLRLSSALEAALTGLFAATLTTAIFVTATSGMEEPVDFLEVGVVGIVGIAPALIIAAVTPAKATAVSTEAHSSPSAGRRRRVVEISIVGLTVATVSLAISRGYADRADPLLALAPFLLALSGAILTVRAYPLPLSSIARWAQRKTGLLPFFGSVRVLRERTLGLLPVLALMLSVSIAAASSILLSILQFDVEQSARGYVGSDLRVSAAFITQEQLEKIREEDGVAFATGLSRPEPVEIDGAERSWVSSLVVSDFSELYRIQEGNAGVLPGIGALQPHDGSIVPVVVSGNLARTLPSDGVLMLNGTITAQVVGVSTGVTPLGSKDWVLIDESRINDHLVEAPRLQTVLISLSEGASAEKVAESLFSLLGSTVRVDRAAELLERAERTPSLNGMRSVLAVAVTLSAVMSAFALAITVSMGAPSRLRDDHVLRSLGAKRSTTNSLLRWDVAPPAVAAALSGGAVGLAIPAVMLATVDLRPFSGSPIQPAYRVDVLGTITPPAILIILVLTYSLALGVVGRRLSRLK